MSGAVVYPQSYLLQLLGVILVFSSESCVSDVSMMGRETVGMLEQVFHELALIKGRNNLVRGIFLQNSSVYFLPEGFFFSSNEPLSKLTSGEIRREG